jgi:RNA polymerase-binding protein DksA
MPLNLDKSRQTLLDLRRRVTGKVEHVAESIREDTNPAGSLSNAPVHLADAAQDIVADVEILATEHDILREIDDALARLDDGSYGKCAQCGQKIASERLAAVPYAVLCIQCARKDEG